ncbi:hypothetical protein JST97_17865 [bacterium]|nr:hypothetical protein [bacterium]
MKIQSLPPVRPLPQISILHSPQPVSSDEYQPGPRERCKSAIGKLGAGIGLTGIGGLGYAMGAAIGHPLAGSLVGGALGTVIGTLVGHKLADKLHPAGKQPLKSSQWTDPTPSTSESVAAMKAGISELQNTLLASGQISKLDRGFHQKQNWGGKAHIEFNADLAPELRSGLLANLAGQSVTSAVRFSNGQGCPFHDSKADARGMAVKMNVDGQQADLLATDHITFARNPVQFMKFAKVAALMQTKGPLSALGAVIRNTVHGDFKAAEALRIMATLIRDTSGGIEHPAAKTYWTQALHVGDLTGRFVFSPESGANTKPPRFGKDPNYLRKNMETDLSHGPVSMKIGFEAFTEDSASRDASQHGQHITLPVGRLVIEQRPSQGREAEEQLVSRMQFNPANGFDMAGPLNESNRAEIYRQSATNRGALDWSAPEVQQFFAKKAP